MLLHSCPDTVHRFLLRKTQTSTPLFRGSPTVKTPSVGQHPCYSGLQVQGAANAPAARFFDYTFYGPDCQDCQPFNSFKYAMKFSLFSSAVVVGRPRSSLAPIEHFTSIRLNSLRFFAAFKASSSASNVSTDTAFG